MSMIFNNEKDLSSIITGRIANINKAVLAYEFSTDDPYTAVDVEFKDQSGGVFDIKVVRIKKAGVLDPKVKKLSLFGVTDIDQAIYYAYIVFNKMVMQRKSTSVTVNSSMLSLNILDRVRMSDPTYFKLTEVDEGGSNRSFTTQEAEIIGSNGSGGYKLSEDITQVDSPGYESGFMRVYITNEFGEVDNSQVYYFVRSGTQFGGIVDSAFNPVINLAFRG